MLGCLRSSGLLRRALPAQHVRGAHHSLQNSGYTTSLNELTTVTVCVSNAASARHGAVLPVLQAFDKHGLSLTHMESRLHQYSFGGVMLEFDFEGSVEDETTQQCLRELTELPFVSQVSHTAPRSVPWFPTSLRDLDKARETLDGGTALINEDHPGFHDEAYKKRRSFIVENARSHAFGKPIPVVDYTEQEF